MSQAPTKADLRGHRLVRGQRTLTDRVMAALGDETLTAHEVTRRLGSASSFSDPHVGSHSVAAVLSRMKRAGKVYQPGPKLWRKLRVIEVPADHLWGGQITSQTPASYAVVSVPDAVRAVKELVAEKFGVPVSHVEVVIRFK